jgi:hypothetical protein
MRMIGKLALLLVPVATAATALLGSTTAYAATGTTALPQLKVQLYGSFTPMATAQRHGVRAETSC